MKQQKTHSYLYITMLLLLSNIVSAGSTDYFISTWKTDNSGITNNTSIQIPAYGNEGGFDIDWENDGVFDEFGIVTKSIAHDYGSPGTYTVAIRNIGRMSIWGQGDRLKLMSIEQWGGSQWQSMYRAFEGASNLIINAQDVPDLLWTTDFYKMFANANSIGLGNGNWNWDTHSATDMSYMFYSCYNFNKDISNWATGNVTTMQSMFNQAFVFNQDISSWSTGLVENISAMFFGAREFNQPIGIWDTNSVLNMSSVFALAYDFNQDLSNWDTSNVQDMALMFYNANSFNQNIGNLNIEKVIDLSYMFDGAKLSTPNYDNLLNGWSKQNLQNGLVFNGGNSKYSSNAMAARNQLINNNAWTIDDGGLEDHDIEVGLATIDHNWKEITLTHDFVEPVILIGSPTYYGSDPVIVRLQNVTKSSFEIKLQEWDYLDGVHVYESVPYMVFEKGHYYLSDGTEIEAGTFDMSGVNEPYNLVYDTPFSSEDEAFKLFTIQTYNGGEAVIARDIDVEDEDYFDTYVSMFEQETYLNPDNSHYGHVEETVGYIRIIGYEDPNNPNKWQSHNGYEISHKIEALSNLNDNWQTVNGTTSMIKTHEEASVEGNHFYGEFGSALVLDNEGLGLIFVGITSFYGSDPFTIRLQR